MFYLTIKVKKSNWFFDFIVYFIFLLFPTFLINLPPPKSVLKLIYLSFVFSLSCFRFCNVAEEMVQHQERSRWLSRRDVVNGGEWMNTFEFDSNCLNDYAIKIFLVFKYDPSNSFVSFLWLLFSIYPFFVVFECSEWELLSFYF